MKNKFLSIITFVLTLIVITPLFCACGNKDEDYTMTFVKYEATTQYTDQNYNTATVNVINFSEDKSISFNASDFYVNVSGNKVYGSNFITGFKTGFKQNSGVTTETYTAELEQSVSIKKEHASDLVIVFEIDNVDQIESFYYKDKKLK